MLPGHQMIISIAYMIINKLISLAYMIKNNDYINSCKNMMNLVVVNDACDCERAFGLIAEFNTNKITTSQTQKQYLYKLVSKLRNQQAKAATSAERCTKAAMKQYL